MNIVNNYSLFNVPKYISCHLKRYSSHFVYHPEQISNEYGKNCILIIILKLLNIPTYVQF